MLSPTKPIYSSLIPCALGSDPSAKMSMAAVAAVATPGFTPAPAALAPFRESRLPLEALGRVFAFAWALEDAIGERRTRAVAALLASREAECSPETMDAVARAGDLEMLRVLHSTSVKGCTPRAMDGAARMGHLRVVQFLHFRRQEGCTAAAFDGAVDGEHVQTARFLLHHVRAKWSPAAAKWAAQNRDMETIRRLVEMDPSVRTGDAKVVAYRLKQTDMLQFLYEHGQDPWPAQTLVEASAAGDLEMVRYLCKHERGFVRSAMVEAIAAGHVEVVKHLHKHAQLRHTSCSRVVFIHDACLHGRLEILQYLHENATELTCTTMAMDTAAARGHLDVVRFLHEHRSEGCTTQAMDMAAMNGHLDVVRFLDSHRSEGCTTLAMDSAAMWGHLETLRYLHEHRSEGCTAKAFAEAKLRGHTQVLEFLHASVNATNFDDAAAAQLAALDMRATDSSTT
jgi:hypothetical protein